MLIELRTADRTLGLKALGIYEKGIEAAQTACEKVYATPLELQSAAESVTSSRGWLATELEDMELGESREFTIPSDYALTIRTACSVYLTQLTKLAEKETDMLVPLDNTNELMSQLRSLADRLAGQTEISSVIGDTKDSTTVSINGSEPITMREFERRVDSLASR